MQKSSLLLKKATALLLALVIAVGSSVVNASADSALTVNGKECYSSYSISYDRTKKADYREFKLEVNGSVISIVNLPDINTNNYGFVIMTPVKYNSQTGLYENTTHGNILRYQTLTADLKSATPTFDMKSMNSYTGGSYLNPPGAVKKGTYLFMLCTNESENSSGYFPIIRCLIEVDSSQNAGVILNSQYYNTNLSKSNSFKESISEKYYKDFQSNIYDSGQYLSEAEEEYVEDLAEEIAEGIPQKAKNREYLMAKAVYTWLAENLYYDYYFFYNQNSTPADIDIIRILESKKAVCEGFAVCYSALLAELNILSTIVYGFAPGQGGNESSFVPGTSNVYSANHAWNEVYIDGEWILVDVTWGCGNQFDGEAFYSGAVSYEYFDAHIQMFTESLLNTNPIVSNSHCTVAYYSPSLSRADGKSSNHYYDLPNTEPLDNGVPYTVEGLQLPETVTKITPYGKEQVSVFWDLEHTSIVGGIKIEDCYYDPDISDRSQSFLVYGLVEDEYVISIRVTVMAKAPKAPEIEFRHANIIKLKEIEGAEYRISGRKWQTSPLFKGLSPNKNYTFEVRYPEKNKNHLILSDYYSLGSKSVSATLSTATSDDFKPGDIDADETFDMKDIVAMAKKVARWDIITADTALDPSGDGKVNLFDVVFLARCFAKWDGYEISKTPYFAD